MGISNMMSHYLTVKENHKDCVVFYRLGDFYEMFFDDAIKVSKLLDLTLTGITAIDFREDGEFAYPVIYSLSNDGHLYEDNITSEYYGERY